MLSNTHKFMARRKANVYSRFNVGVFMKERRRVREEAAKAHKVLVKEKAKLSKLIRKVSIHAPSHPQRRNMFNSFKKFESLIGF